MNKLIRRPVCWVLVLALLGALILIPPQTKVSAAETGDSTGNTSAATDIQSGVTLHCWNWSFKNIEENMALIASLGYTAIQTSPIQQAKQATAGYPVNDWWVYYQPAGFTIDDTGTSALGTKAEFESMCETAHEYGIYVIVDVVANHLGNTSGNDLSSAIPSDIRDDSSCWHDISTNISNYNDRYNITQYCLDGVPDLNTGSDKIQTYVLNYLKECIDAGADGFRFDAAKHIETPDDEYCASDFWPTVVDGAKEYASSERGIDLYCYGELLYHPDEAGSLPDSAYTKYMSVTDNSWSNTVRNSVVGSSNASAYSYSYHKNADADQLVLWAESHDNYAGDGSSSMSAANINKTWALVAARADAMALYLARPENTYPQLLGTAAVTGWSYDEVAAVNHFHNYFAGQTEYVSNSGSIAYVERGTSGAVLVNCSGTSTSVSVTANAMADGTYTDQITGNTFTVSGGKITGQIGSTGIAVVYNAVECDHESHNTSGYCAGCGQNVGHTYVDGTCSVCGAEEPEKRVIYYDNSSTNWSSVYIYAWDADATAYAGAWPGSAMTKVSGESNIYCFELSGEATSVIFSDGGTNQTDDLTLSSDKNMYSSGSWTTYTPSDSGDSGNTITLYYDNSSTNWSSVYIYAWDADATAYAGAWPGSAMTKVSGETSIYSYELPEGATKVIFSNGGTNQTDDLTLSSDKNMYSSGSWTTYTPSDSGGSGDTITLYYDNTVTNWSNVYLFAWDANSTQYTGTWPGAAMTLVEGESSVYYYELSTNAEYMIFNNGSDMQCAGTDVPAASDGLNMYNQAMGSWSAYGVEVSCTHSSHDILGECGSCGETVDHRYSTVVTAPTCTESGYTTYTCVVCGQNYNHNYVDATGHTATGAGVVTAPTCTGQGYTTYICAVCGQDYQGEFTAAVGHSFGDDNICDSCGGRMQITINMADSYVGGMGTVFGDGWYGNALGIYADGVLIGTATITQEEGNAATWSTDYDWSKEYTFNWVADTYNYSFECSFEILVGEEVVFTATTDDCADYTDGQLLFTLESTCTHSYSSVVTAPTCTEEGYTTYTCTACGYISTGDTVGATGHSYSDGICTDCGAADPDAAAQFTLAGANMVLGGVLDMNFFINQTDISGTDYYAEITHYAQSGTKVITVPYSEWGTYGPYYTLTLEGLEARQMADKIEVVIYSTDGTQVSETWTDSIRDYSMRTYEARNEEGKTLLVDMLNYGAAAQTFFGYNASDLANNQLTEEQLAYATDSVSCTDQRVQGDNYVGSTLVLESRIILTLLFKDVTTDMYAVVTYTDHYGVVQEITVQGSEFSQYYSYYGVMVDELVVADGNQLVTVTVYNADGTVFGSATDSMNSYAARKLESDPIYEMVAKFTASAYAYFHE